MNNIIPFEYKAKTIRVIQDEQGEPWWVAKDVCEILEIDITQIRRLDEDEKGLYSIQTPGGPQQMGIVNESGLYNLILASKKPEAKPFKRWTTHEVLPSIRKTGSYQISGTQKVASLTPITKELRAAIGMAKLLGLKGNQAILSANMLVRRLTGHDCMDLMELKHLTCEKQEIHLTASDIGKRLGDISAQQVHKLLETQGLIESHRDKKNRLYWKPTEKGKPYTILKDTGKKQGDGTPVQQLMYLESILENFDTENALNN